MNETAENLMSFIEWVEREIWHGRATAADIRIAIENAAKLDDAGVPGYSDEDVADLIEAFMLLASEDELDAWRSEKVRRLSDEMDEAEAAHRADPRPVLVDAAFMLSRDQLTNALREAAAQGMDRTSGPSCEEAASCREVADEIIEAIDAGRFSPDGYGYRVEDERRAS